MAAPAGLTTDAVRARASAMVSDDLVLVPVRHHSPACARQVARLAEIHRPRVVLVEGPRDFDAFIPLLLHPDAVPPLALYAHRDRDAGYYPFCDYSPELVALRAAADLGVESHFIDLTFAEQAVLDARADPTPRSILEERRFAISATLRHLADQLGYADVEDLWEALFEADAATVAPEEHLARLTAYCLLARSDATPASLAADGTTAREAEMAFHIRRWLDTPGDGPVLVVVGGFHAVALPDLLAHPPRRPSIKAGRAPTGAALIRYSFDRLDRLNGYASGMTSPAWHQRLWEGDGDRAALALEVVLDVADRLRRRHRAVVPTPTVRAAHEQAVGLARLRGHPGPLRCDVLDALLSCYVQGDADTEGAVVRAAARSVLTGDRVGVLPPGTGTPPLVTDTLARLKARRITTTGGERKRAALDLYRHPEHRVTSRLLHGLALLQVPFARREGGPDFARGTGLGRLQERWVYAWTPATEGALVERSSYGSTLPEAVEARFSEQLASFVAEGGRRDAAGAAGLLATALALGLHERAGPIVDVVREAIAADAGFASVVRATGELGLLWEGREPLEAQRLAAVPDLVRTAYERALYLGATLAPADSEAGVTGLLELRELVARAPTLDDELFWQLVGRLTASEAALLRGAASGLLRTSGRLAPEGVARAVAGHFTGTVPAADAVAFTRGLLLTARESAWQDAPLLERLDALIAGWEAEEFLTHLPQLRLAFAQLTPYETDRVARLAAGLHGSASVGPLWSGEVTEAAVAANLAVSDRVRALLDADGLVGWAAR